MLAEVVLKIIIALLLIGTVFGVQVHAQEARLATFHETVTILVDQRLSNNVTASVSLQTTSIQEFLIPPHLDAKIRETPGVVAVIVTNEDQCVLGVVDQICVMINTKRFDEDAGIQATQQRAIQIGNLLIDDINDALKLNAQFHSVFIHYDDSANRELGTAGEVSGSGIVSAVYTAPMQSTDFMFNTMSTILIPKQIRDFGGFYDVARNLSRDDDSRMTISVLPRDGISIMNLKVSKSYPRIASELVEIDPLKYLNTDKIKKSDYFSFGFFPLNSLVQVVALLKDDVEPHVKNIIEPTEINGQIVPSALTKSGWFFETDSKTKIEAIYLFGESFTAERPDLLISFDKSENITSSFTIDEVYIIIGIGVAAAGATAYYLKGIKRKP
ncbi:MAG: hypothetical protein QXW91_02000 [Candidatus Nitrosotenuis sp.]